MTLIVYGKPRHNNVSVSITDAYCPGEPSQDWTAVDLLRPPLKRIQKREPSATRLNQQPARKPCLQLPAESLLRIRIERKVWTEIQGLRHSLYWPSCNKCKFLDVAAHGAIDGHGTFRLGKELQCYTSSEPSYQAMGPPPINACFRAG